MPFAVLRVQKRNGSDITHLSTFSAYNLPDEVQRGGLLKAKLVVNPGGPHGSGWFNKLVQHR
jgi:hypothetical protein